MIACAIIESNILLIPFFRGRQTVRTSVSETESFVRAKNHDGSHAIAYGVLGGDIDLKSVARLDVTNVYIVQGLGKLAEKFPNIAGTSISYLRDFLVDPSPILAKLYNQAQQKKDKEQFKIVGE